MADRVAPTITVTPARVRLAEPSQRPGGRAGEWLETSWGRCQVKGRLGQRHMDVLEAIMFHAQSWELKGDGAAWLIIDPAALRRAISDGNHSSRRLKEWLVEIMQAVVCIEAPRLGEVKEGHLIDERRDAPTLVRDPLPMGPKKRGDEIVEDENRRRSGHRTLWEIRLGSPMMFLLAHDVTLWHDPAPISKLRHGISQAIARLMLSHSDQEGVLVLFIETAIKAVCGQDIAAGALRKARHLIKQDKDRLLDCGIFFDGERLRRVPQRPDAVPHRPNSIPHRPGAFRRGPGHLGLSGSLEPEQAALAAAQAQAQPP